MFDINRSLIIVRPKQPFFEWAQSVAFEEELTLEDVREDPTAYLIPEPWDKDEQATILIWCFERVFEAELESWYTDQAAWPQHRDLKMFLEWFEVEFLNMVFDLLDEPIEVVDFGFEDDPDVGSNGN